MKSCMFLTSVFSFLFMGSGPPSSAQERIISYYVDLRVENDGGVVTTEDITVWSEGEGIQRGIFREFPTRYEDKNGNAYVLGFEVLEVLRDGQIEPFFMDESENAVRVYIGDADVLLIPAREYSYRLKFRTTRQVGFFEDFDELYVNAIGTNWDFRIDTAVVKLQPPDGAEILSYSGYTGYAGSTACNCIIEQKGDHVVFASNMPLNGSEGFTVAVSWPKGFVPEPTLVQRSNYFLADNGYIIIGILGFVFVFGYLFNTWRRVGKDPAKGHIVPRFGPPDKISPAGARYLMKMGFDNTAFTSALVNMAVKGYLKIEQDEKKKYTIKRIGKNEDKLTEGEKALAKPLFWKEEEVKLDRKNYQQFQKAQLKLTGRLKHEVRQGNFELNGKYILIAFGMSFAVLALMMILSQGYGIRLTIAVAVGFIVMLIVFGVIMKAPTEKGRQLMDQLEGLKMYLKDMKGTTRASVNAPKLDKDLFERMLPYAIALGVEDNWSKEFENQLADLGTSKNYHPMWYNSALHGHFSPSQISRSVSSSFTSSVSSASTAPGGSSGSSGGGSSGGGSGGGGGGGW